MIALSVRDVMNHGQIHQTEIWTVCRKIHTAFARETVQEIRNKDFSATLWRRRNAVLSEA